MHQIRHPFTRFILATLLAGASSLPFAAVTSTQPDTVGEATLVIGQAKLVGADGVTRMVDRGTAIRVGDRVETGVGGHVHLRFVDGGRLSVRPSSRLQVENYNRNLEQPGLTAIKFRLDEGVVRSITGAWGEAARDRFRLNTPVAAIGVKGTDFVVQSSATNTQATVYTGAIVLSPLSAACQDSLGPCNSGSEKLLSQDMKGQMLTLNGVHSSPQLVAAVDLLAQRQRSPQADGPDTRVVLATGNFAPEKTSVVDKTASVEIRATEVVATQAVAAVAAVELAQRTSEVQPPVVVPVVVPPVVSQLAWARLSSIAAEGDVITRTHAQAQALGFAPGLGNFAYSLYRQGSADAPLTTAETSANFRLAGSAASLVWDDRGTDVTDPAQVTSGSLKVDFAKNTYATQLGVTSARIGSDTLSTSGTIARNGYLTGSANGVSTAGALSLDAKEAALLFEKTYLQGQLRGVTLWGR